MSSSAIGALTAEISSHTFTKNVRAIYASSVNLTLNSGNIVENNNLTWGNGAIIYLSNSIIIITGGKVADNIGAENVVINVAGGSFEMDGTMLTGNSGYSVVGTGSAANITMRNLVAAGNTSTANAYSGGSVLNANRISGKTVSLENVTATDNQNTKEHGGAFYLGGSSSNASTVIEITNCKLTGNTAKNGGGAIHLNNQTPNATMKHLTVGATANIALLPTPLRPILLLRTRFSAPLWFWSARLASPTRTAPPIP